MYLEFLWVLLLGTNSLVLCVDFPANSRVLDDAQFQTLVDQMSLADIWAPDWCESHIDELGVLKRKAQKAPTELIHLKWKRYTTKEIKAGELGHFETAYKNYFKTPQGTNVFKTYFSHIYHSGPFQALVEAFQNAQHELFVGKNQDEIIATMVDIWENDADYSAFKHVFFGEKWDDKTYAGLHSYYGYYLMQKKNYVLFYKMFKHRYHVVAQIKFGWKEDKDVGDMYMKNAHSMLLNKSPAFELSLYTALLLLHSKNKLTKDAVTTDYFNIDGCRLRFVVAYQTENSNPVRLKTIYPEKYGEQNKDCEKGDLVKYRKAMELRSTRAGCEWWNFE